MLVDAPTERLPIFQSVLDQWFLPEEDGPASTDYATASGMLDDAPTLFINTTVDEDIKPIIPPLDQHQRAELAASQPSYEVMEAVRDGLRRLYNQ